MSYIHELGAVGDGRADSAAALQRAVEEGGGLELPAGTYRISRPITIDLGRHGPWSVVGDGTATLVMAGAGPALRFIGSHEGTANPESVKALTYSHERSPRVAGLEIVGAHPEADGVELRKCFKPILTGLLIRECRVGIHLVERNRDVLIDHCHVYNNRAQGIFLDALNLHQINISDCHISYNQGGGIVAFGSQIRNLQIAGCDIEYNYDSDNLERATADIWVETRGDSLREGAITGCTVQARPCPGGANIRFIGESAEVAHKVGLFCISGNLISSQEVQIHLRYARGVSITGNTFFSGHKRNIVIEDSSNVVVGSNVFDHNPDYAKETLDGIKVQRTRGVIINGNQFSDTRHPDGAVEIRDSQEICMSGNQILNPATYGITVADSRNVRVSDTTILDARDEPRIRAAISFDNARGCQVHGCRLSPGRQAAIAVENSDVATNDGDNLIAPP